MANLDHIPFLQGNFLVHLARLYVIHKRLELRANVLEDLQPQKRIGGSKNENGGAMNSELKKKKKSY